MTTSHKTILLLLPLLVLVSLSLYHQLMRPVPIGMRLSQALQAANPRKLGGALPLVVADPGLPAAVDWQRQPSSTVGVESFTTADGQWGLLRQYDAIWPERQRLMKPQVTQPLLEALRRLGYMNQRPQELLDAARASLEGKSDEELLLAVLQADGALFEQRTTISDAVREALLLCAREYTGAAVTIKLPQGRLYVLELAASALDQSNMVGLLRMDAAGKGLWSGVLSWPKRPMVDTHGAPATPVGMLRGFCAQYN